MNSQAPASEGISNSQTPVPPVEINRSCCLPVLLLLTCSVGWLVVAGILGMICAIKLHSAGFLSGSAWLTYGRLYPAYTTALVYGFAAQAGLGIGLWILARLSRTALFGPVAATIACLFWNAGVKIGIFGILAGAGSGFETFEIPSFASPILLFSYSVIALCGLMTFHRRRERQVYVSQWYLVLGLFWFPWIFSTASLLLHYFPIRGVMQAVIGGWYAHNLHSVWLTSLGLAAVFYFLPKIVNRPLHSQGMAAFGFWSLAFLGSWGGASSGAPVPSWLTSVSAAAAVLMLIPLLAVAVNWHLTLKGQGQKLAPHSVLPFIKFGAFCFVVGSLLQILGAAHSPGSPPGPPHDASEAMQSMFGLVSGLAGQIASVTRFTHYGSGVAALFLFGFLGMVAAGGIYYIVPKLTQCEWPSAQLIKFHFRCGATGVVFVATSLVFAGLRQGSALNDSSVPFLTTVRGTIPFLGIGTLGMLLLLAGALALGLNLARLLMNCRCSDCCPSVARAGV